MKPDDTPEPPWQDPIVTEVRAIRAELLAEAGGDLDALFADLKASELGRGRRVVLPPPKPSVTGADAA